MFISEDIASLIVQDIKKITGYDINIMDEQGIIFASTDSARIGQHHEGAKIILAEKLDWLTVEKDASLNGARPGINLPIEVEGKVVGIIGITGLPEKVSPLGAVIKRLTEIMVRDARQRENGVILNEARRHFIENWLFDEMFDEQEMAMRGKLIDIDIYQQWTVAVLDISEPEDMSKIENSPVTLEIRNAQVLKTIQLCLHSEDHCLCAVVNQRVLLLFSGIRAKAVADRLAEIRSVLKSTFNISVCGGISANSYCGKSVQQGYREAKAACKIAFFGAKKIKQYNEMSLEFVTNSIPEDIRANLRDILFHSCNSEERKEMIETLQIYYKYDGNILRASEELYIHKNTLHYRLRKIEDKTGYSVHNPIGNIMLYLAQFVSTMDK